MRTRRTKVLGGRCDGQEFDLPAGQTEVFARDDRLGYRYELRADGVLHFTGESWPLPAELQDPGDLDWPTLEREIAQYAGLAPLAPEITIAARDPTGSLGSSQPIAHPWLA